MMDSAAWTGRTGEWRVHSALPFEFRFAYVERDTPPGMMLPIYGWVIGLDYCRCEWSVRLYWPWREWLFFRRPWRAN